MISKEQIDNCKEALYMYCTSKRYCVLCALNEPHEFHDIRVGTLKIGVLENLFKVLDGVLHDTTPTHFRLTEAAAYLESQGYLELKSLNFLSTLFFITPKLLKDMENKQDNPKTEKVWY